MFEIESHIPAPRAPRRKNNGHRHVGRPPIYPFDRMNVGDSFFMPNTCFRGSNETRTLIGSAAIQFLRNSGLEWQFTTSACEGGARVWRIK